MYTLTKNIRGMEFHYPDHLVLSRTMTFEPHSILHNFKSWPSQENSHNMISPLFVLSTYTPTDI